ALRLGDDKVTADEFDWIVLKRTEIHQSLVLDAFPPPQSEWRCRHGPNLAGPGTGVNINLSMSLGHHPHNRGSSASRMASPGLVIGPPRASAPRDGAARSPR